MNSIPLTSAERGAQQSLTAAEYDRFLPLVRRIAMRFARRVPRHITVADLVSCGWLGLLEAHSRAAPGMPVNEFEAYASYRVRGAMLDFLRSADMVSRHHRRSSRDLARTITQLTRNLGRAPLEAEIATALGLTEPQYHTMLSAIAEAGMVRLELMDFDQIEAGDRAELPDEGASRKEIGAALAAAIEELPPRLRHLVALYYQHECTLRQAGEVLGVTESRASQLHTEAIHRLRAAIGRE